MSSRARKAAIEDDEWERVRPIIHQLYLVDGKTQRDTLKILSEYHNLDPRLEILTIHLGYFLLMFDHSKAQLERKLKQWRMVRNMTGPEWKYVDRVIRQRQSHGKGSQLYLAGIPLRPAAIEKARFRHCYETAFEKIMPKGLPLIVRTPSPVGRSCWNSFRDVPWFQLQGFLRGFTLKIPRHRSDGGNAFRYLRDNLLTFSPKSVGKAPTHTIQLQYMYQALSLIMPGRSQEDHVSTAENVLSRTNFTCPESVKIVFFLLSNNFLNKASFDTGIKAQEILDSLFELLYKANGWAMMTAQPYSKLSSSLQATLDRLFTEAVDRFDSSAVRSLLRTGFSVDQPLRVTGLLRKYGVGGLIRPFEYAALMFNTEMTRLLVENGAKPKLYNLDRVCEVIERFSEGERHMLSWIQFILPHLVFVSQYEPALQRILRRVERSGKSLVAEELIRYFCERVVAAQSISQLIVTAIRTESSMISSLISQNSEYLDTPSPFGETPLMAAASEGNLPVCEQLLLHGASIEPKPERSSICRIATPLQCAAYFADTKTVHYFLNSGAQINFLHPTDAQHPRCSGPGVLCYLLFLSPVDSFATYGSLGRTALQAALLGRNEATARLLLAEGAEVFGGELAISIRTRLSKLIMSIPRSKHNFLPGDTMLSGLLTSTLEAAIIAGDHNLALRELNESPSSVTPEALYAAIWFTNLKSASGFAFLRRILEQGAGLRQCTSHWVGTAMVLAATLDSLEVVELILDSGLRPSTCYIRSNGLPSVHTFRQQYTSGTRQTEEGYLKWLALLLSYVNIGDKIWPMVDAAAYIGRRDYLDLLFGHDYEPTTSCAKRGVESLSLNILQCLENRGAKMTQYVLAASIGNGCSDITEWLLSLGLDLNEEVVDTEPGENFRFTKTALQAAANKGDLVLLDRLVHLGANVNAPAYHLAGATALQAASIHGFFGMVQKLLELGADPNASGALQDGRTALEGAAEDGRLDVVQLLLNSGVETDGPGRRQYVRAIGFAKRSGHAAVARLLRSHRLWTEADQEILDDDRLLGEDPMFPRPASHHSKFVYQNVDDSRGSQNIAVYCQPHELSDEKIPPLNYEASKPFGLAGCKQPFGLVTERDDQSHSDDGYIESDIGCLGVIHREEAELLDVSEAQESSVEAENDFRPSGIFDQVKRDLELSSEVNGIWAEAYHAFSLETLY